jgi:hypothetical protein
MWECGNGKICPGFYGLSGTLINAESIRVNLRYLREKQM